MLKPKPFVDWMRAHRVFRAPDIPDDHIEMRDDELFRMFPDVGCRWEFDAIEGASMWDAFTAQRAEECGLEEVAAGRKKNGEPVGEIRQLWLWGNESHAHSTWTDSLDERDKRLWRIGGAPNMWTMCDSRVGESVAGLTALELTNLLAGLHPMDFKRHGYTLTRLLTKPRYLERKAEDMDAHMQNMHAQITHSSSSSSVGLALRRS